MPLVYQTPGIPDFIIRKPPSHFVFDTEADLISRHAVAVYRTWATKLLPQLRSARLDVENLLQFRDLVDRMTLWDTLDDGGDYLIRFHGAEVGRIFGEGMGGRLSRTPKPLFDALMKILELGQSTSSVVVNGPALNAMPERQYLVSQSLFMPVFADDVRVQQVLVYSDYFTSGKIERATRVDEGEEGRLREALNPKKTIPPE